MQDRDKTQDQLIAELELLRGEVATFKQTGRSHPETHLPQTTPAAANLTIVLIDDSEVDRATYRRYLMEDRDRTYQIVEFDNGEDALEWCQQQIPDIFLLDYFLPDMDGLELLQQLQQQTGRNTLPVIMFTGQGNIQIAVDLLKSGAQDYLDKSQITPQILQKSISYILQQNQLIREREWQQQQQQLLAKTALSIRDSLKLEDILNTTVREVRNILLCDRVIIFKFSAEWGGTVLVESVADDCMAILPLQIYDPCIGKDYVEPFKKGLITAKSDIYNSGISPCHIEFLESLQVRANLVVPITKGDELWGLLVVHHCTAPREWQASEIELLRQLSAQVSIAIQQADLFEQLQAELRERQLAQIALQQLNAELEQRVIERTAELTEVNDRLLVTLLEKEHAYQRLEEQAQLLDLAHDSIITWDLNSVITFWNQGAEFMYGWTKAEAFGQESHTFFKTQFPQPLAEIEAQLLEQGYWEGEVIHFTKDDRAITVSSRWVAQKDDAGRPIKILEINNDISDRKRLEDERKNAEIALRESEEQRRLALDLTETGFWDMHISNNTIVWNDNFCKLMGLVAGDREASYQLWRDHVHPEDVSWVEQKFLESLTNRTYYEAEYRVLHPDGSVHWILGRGQAVYNEFGQPLRSLGVLLDISDRKQAEANLLQKSKQEHLLWSITQAIRQSLDFHAILNTAVAEVRQTLQTDRAAIYRFYPDWIGDFVVESVGEDWVKLVESGVGKIWADTYLQETQGGRFRNKESFVINDIYRAGLQPCHIELLEQFQAKAYAIAPIFSGETLWGLLAIYENATPRDWQSWEVELLEQIASQLSIAIQQSELYEQLQIELQERQLAEATIREAERRWRSLLDNVQLIVVGLDIGGNVNYVNPFFLKLTGYTNLEVLGENWFENFLPPASQESLKTVFSEVLTHNAPPYYRNSILTKSGEERFIAWNNTTLQDAESNIIGNISIGEDITERKKIDEIKDEFIGIVSHELRTPLTAIQMSLGLIQTGIYDKKPEKARRMIEIALLDTHRLVNLVNDILDLERIDSGRVVLEKTVCKAADLMQQAIERIQAIATQEQITLTFTPTDVEVWAAPDTIIQTLTNLLGNALKFSPAQSTIHLSAEIQTDFVLFQVCDRGRGIPADQLELIFGRFQQVDASDSREKGGTGLGLSICQSIIERHGGKIWAESSLGEGSTFFFTLPLPTIEF
ncbi:MAG: PAS domain S-box protein [Microcoleus sp.]